MNYGETLASWYLRLNGFFTIPNYVLHQKKDVLAYSADCDIIAIRPPHIYEEIGGQPHDWDRKFEEFGIDIRTKTVGVIVEVKTGKFSKDDITTGSFGPDRISYALKRLGFWPYDTENMTIEEICTHLRTHPHFENDTHYVMKLLIADISAPIARLPIHQLSLKEVDTFISNRFELYKQKFPDRHFFPSDLMQYMIWKSTPREC